MSSIASLSAAASSTAVPKAPPQGGVLEGVNPVHFDAKNPIILFIVQASYPGLKIVAITSKRVTILTKHQASIIIIFCRALHWPLSKIRQPRVISEIIGGILLGPSVLGRIPGFQESIFPTQSMTNLNLIANLGLTLFLFIIGLEVDLRFLLSNWKVALNVGVVSMAIPFGLGCAIAVGLYNQFKHEPGMVEIEFPIFMLFIGVAMAITVGTTLKLLHAFAD
jgi:Kef-type K+ transport system membrane component KefB